MNSRWDIFRDDNNWNEKTIIGGISFALVVIYSLVFLFDAMFTFEMELNESIFTGLLTITLGSFGISEISKSVQVYSNKNSKKPNSTPISKSHSKKYDDEFDDYMNSE